MINENKVKMLSKLAMTEKKYGKTKKELEAVTKKNTVIRGIVWTVICTAVAFVAILVVWTACKGTLEDNWRRLLNNPFDIFSDTRLWIEFFMLEAIFVVIAGFYYSNKYVKMRDELEEYKKRQANYNDFYNR